MKSLLSLFFKGLKFIEYKKQDYFFERSKEKHVIRWGEHTYGQPEIVCYDNRSKLSVGSYTSIASNVSILLGANHKGGLLTTYPRSKMDPRVSQQETNERGGVRIGSDVWIGYGATIIGSVTIGDGAIVGAEALVVDDVPPYAVVGGVPARVIKHRFDETSREALLKVRWWDKTEREIRTMEHDLYSTDIEAFIAKHS